MAAPVRLFNIESACNLPLRRRTGYNFGVLLT
jgi:hypothetical protein